MFEQALLSVQDMYSSLCLHGSPLRGISVSSIFR